MPAFRMAPISIPHHARNSTHCGDNATDILVHAPVHEARSYFFRTTKTSAAAAPIAHTMARAVPHAIVNKFSAPAPGDCT